MISIAAVVRLASIDMACTVAVTSLPHGGTPLVTGWADPWGKAVCSDEFGFSGALCVPFLSPPSLNSNVSKGVPMLSPMQSHLKSRLISENALFSKKKQNKGNLTRAV